MNLAPQVETAAISDSDLDSISGGLAAGGSGGLFLETPLGDLGGDLTAVGSAEGLSAGTSLHATSH